MLSPNRLSAPTSTPGKPPEVSARATASPSVSGLLSDAKRVVGRLIDPNMKAFASPPRWTWISRLVEKIKTPNQQHLDGAVVKMLDSQLEVLEGRATFRQRAACALKVDGPLDDVDGRCLKKVKFTRSRPRERPPEPVSQVAGNKTRTRLAKRAAEEAQQPVKRVCRDTLGRVQVMLRDS